VVFTVKEGTLKSNPVQILRGHKDTVIIGEGLSEGDLIVKSPLSSPVDGQIVRLKEGLSEGDLIVKSPLSSPVDGQIVRLKPDGS